MNNSLSAIIGNQNFDERLGEMEPFILRSSSKINNDAAFEGKFIQLSIEIFRAIPCNRENFNSTRFTLLRLIWKYTMRNSKITGMMFPNLIETITNDHPLISLIACRSIFFVIRKQPVSEDYLYKFTESCNVLLDRFSVVSQNYDYLIFYSELIIYLSQVCRIEGVRKLFERFFIKLFCTLRLIMKSANMYQNETLTIELVNFMFRSMKLLYEFNNTKDFRMILPDLCLFILNFCPKNALIFRKEIMSAVASTAVNQHDMFFQILGILFTKDLLLTDHRMLKASGIQMCSEILYHYREKNVKEELYIVYLNILNALSEHTFFNSELNDEDFEKFKLVLAGFLKMLEIFNGMKVSNAEKNTFFLKSLGEISEVLWKTSQYLMQKLKYVEGLKCCKCILELIEDECSGACDNFFKDGFVKLQEEPNNINDEDIGKEEISIENSEEMKNNEFLIDSGFESMVNDQNVNFQHSQDSNNKQTTCNKIIKDQEKIHAEKSWIYDKGSKGMCICSKKHLMNNLFIKRLTEIKLNLQYIKNSKQIIRGTFRAIKNIFNYLSVVKDPITGFTIFKSLDIENIEKLEKMLKRAIKFICLPIFSHEDSIFVEEIYAIFTLFDENMLYKIIERNFTFLFENTIQCLLKNIQYSEIFDEINIKRNNSKNDIKSNYKNGKNKQNKSSKNISPLISKVSVENKTKSFFQIEHTCITKIPNAKDANSKDVFLNRDFVNKNSESISNKCSNRNSESQFLDNINSKFKDKNFIELPNIRYNDLIEAENCFHTEFCCCTHYFARKSLNASLDSMSGLPDILSNDKDYCENINIVRNNIENTDEERNVKISSCVKNEICSETKLMDQTNVCSIIPINYYLLAENYSRCDCADCIISDFKSSFTSNIVYFWKLLLEFKPLSPMLCKNFFISMSQSDDNLNIISSLFPLILHTMEAFPNEVDGPISQQIESFMQYILTTDEKLFIKYEILKIFLVCLKGCKKYPLIYATLSMKLEYVVKFLCKMSEMYPNNLIFIELALFIPTNYVFLLNLQQTFSGCLFRALEDPNLVKSGVLFLNCLVTNLHSEIIEEAFDDIMHKLTTDLLNITKFNVINDQIQKKRCQIKNEDSNEKNSLNGDLLKYKLGVTEISSAIVTNLDEINDKNIQAGLSQTVPVYESFIDRPDLDEICQLALYFIYKFKGNNRLTNYVISTKDSTPRINSILYNEDGFLEVSELIRECFEIIRGKFIHEHFSSLVSSQLSIVDFKSTILESSVDLKNDGFSIFYKHQSFCDFYTDEQFDFESLENEIIFKKTIKNKTKHKGDQNSTVQNRNEANVLDPGRKKISYTAIPAHFHSCQCVKDELKYDAFRFLCAFLFNTLGWEKYNNEGIIDKVSMYLMDLQKNGIYILNRPEMTAMNTVKFSHFTRIKNMSKSQVVQSKQYVYDAVLTCLYASKTSFSKEVFKLFELIYLEVVVYRVVERFKLIQFRSKFYFDYSAFTDPLLESFADLKIGEDMLEYIYKKFLEICCTKEIIYETFFFQDLIGRLISFLFNKNIKKRMAGFNGIYYMVKKIDLGQKFILYFRCSIIHALFYYISNGPVQKFDDIQDLINYILRKTYTASLKDAVDIIRDTSLKNKKCTIKEDSVISHEGLFLHNNTQQQNDNSSHDALKLHSDKYINNFSNLSNTVSSNTGSKSENLDEGISESLFNDHRETEKIDELDNKKTKVNHKNQDTNESSIFCEKRSDLSEDILQKEVNEKNTQTAKNISDYKADSLNNHNVRKYRKTRLQNRR
ncbi:hypothetical protein EDEG_00386 [Edhazardia aedis USNM 41457]|uniref:Uncharacterized protein n=1 Tax=Edhazardia aedis (strain USNM 41457) TaxID=1003232 RepID=J9DGJ3_EDHAE|nr:hypothetical protein EDEG_00386 [Edhazardia aedis USNM 41457]|eukprot:EJW01720.1 hypothetical protein EDEG_00386 [Edhazardia aedis USNM 41457]